MKGLPNMTYTYDTDDEPGSVLPDYLITAIERCFAARDAGTDYNAREALEVIARMLPYAGDTGDVIETVFPYDGPHSRDTVTDGARAMAAIGRYLNNATQQTRIVGDGQALAAVVGNVKTVLFQLDQLLEQTAGAALRLAENPELYSDQTPYPGEGGRAQWLTDRHDDGVRAAMQVADTLHEVRGKLVVWDSEGFMPVGGLARELEAPHSLANQLGMNVAEQDDEDDAPHS